MLQRLMALVSLSEFWQRLLVRMVQMNSWPFMENRCEFGSLGCRKTLEKGHGRGVRGEGFGGRGQWRSAGVLPFAAVTTLFFSSPNWAFGPSSQHILFD